MTFGDQLERRIGPILKAAGFHLAERFVSPVEALVYERPHPLTSKLDRITFHGDDESSSHLYCEVVSGLKPGLFLKTLKELLPNFASLGYPEYNRWTYTTEEELAAVLQEIGSLIETKLLDWLQNPIPNPSGESTEPKFKLSRDDIIQKFEETIAIFERLAHEARVRGDSKEAEQHEEAVRFYRQQLSNLIS